LHGLQNKKDNLDSFYGMYEEEFEERRQVESLFNIVLGEIRTIMPEMSASRWRKKSDFYTLFLVIAERARDLPFAREARDRLRERLLAFAQGVDQFLREPAQDPGPEVRTYSAAVERAASDLASRRRRAEVVRAIVEACAPSDAAAASV
jgi:hypothetical protein